MHSAMYNLYRAAQPKKLTSEGHLLSKGKADLYALVWQVSVLIQHEANVLPDIEGVKQRPILEHHANFELAG